MAEQMIALSKVRELEAELAEARLDRARMDWLELQVGSANVRAAIDAAMQEAKCRKLIH